MHVSFSGPVGRIIAQKKTMQQADKRAAQKKKLVKKSPILINHDHVKTGQHTINLLERSTTLNLAPIAISVSIPEEVYLQQRGLLGGGGYMRIYPEHGEPLALCRENKIQHTQ